MFEKELLATKTEACCPDSGVAGGLISTISAQVIRLHPARHSDQAFFYQVYGSTRLDELALTGWDAAQQEAFLRMQYEAQRRSYRMQMPNAEYWVIRCDEVAAGRLIVDRTAEEIHVVDIALVPKFRRRGIGSTLMHAILTEAEGAAKAVRLHVERFNPALHWYEQLGFRVVDQGPIYREMLWRSSSKPQERLEQRLAAPKSETETGLCQSI